MVSQIIPQRDSHKRSAKTKVLLTEREQQVMRLLCEGMTMKEIADELFLSHHTVISHKRNMLTKFQARNVVQMVGIWTKYSK